MANSFSIPEDLYFWHQDRLGSLLPMLASFIVSVFPIESIYAVTIVLYGMLYGIWYFLSSFLREVYGKILLLVIVFIPFPVFFEQVYVGHPYCSQFFLMTLSIFLFEKTKSLHKPWLSFASLTGFGLTLFLSIWVSEASVLFIFSFFVMLIISHLRVSSSAKGLVITTEINFKNAVRFLAPVITSLIIVILFIKWAKSYTHHNAGYDKFFVEWDVFSKAFITFVDLFLDTVHFRDSSVFISVHNILVTIMVLIMAGVTFYNIQKQKFRFNFITGVFFLNAFLSFFFLLASNWVHLMDYSYRYFTYSYFSLAVSLVFYGVGINYGPVKKVYLGLYTLALCAMSYGSYALCANPTGAGKELSAKQLQKLDSLGECGIIGDFWYSYVLGVNHSKMILTSPHEKSHVRSYKPLYSLFQKPHIYLVKNLWFDSFPDTISEFGYLLTKAKPPFNIGDLTFCEYNKQTVDRVFYPKDMQSYIGSPGKVFFNNIETEAIIANPDATYNGIFVAGPQVHLHKGKYKVIMYMMVVGDLNDKDEVTFEITEEWGSKSVQKQVFHKGDFVINTEKKVIFLLNVNRPMPEVEFRVWYNGKANMFFKKAELKYLPD
ncbi:MAG: hypothetical protein ACXVPN_02100 [Bacteroidia bacterium]